MSGRVDGRKVLFVIPSLPRDRVSTRGISSGHEPLSGSLTSFLLVIEELSRRTGRVGVVVLDGRAIVDTAAVSFTGLDEALAWSGSAPIVWCSWGDHETLWHLNDAGIRPIVWLQTHIDRVVHEALSSGKISGLVVVSDLARLTSLHSSHHRRIGRVHNPLNPFFVDEVGGGPARYSSESAVFTGYLGKSKGAHRVLQAWSHVRERMPRATLTVIGSAKLYGADRSVGPAGVADPDFETNTISKFFESHSGEDGGVRLAGLLSPAEIREIYRDAALGIVNLNWHGSTETFCCTAVEMLATGLPVVGAARGGLPETIGASGGAVLVDSPDLGVVADAIVRLLQEPGRLQQLGRDGRDFVRSYYEIGRIADRWERILEEGASRLDRASGPWEYRGRQTRYFVERLCGSVGMGWALESGKMLAQRLAGGRSA